MTPVDDQPVARTVVRRAVPADIPQMVMMGRQFANESGFTKYGIHPTPHALHTSFEKFLSDDNYAVFVADRAGELIGFSGAVISSVYFSGAVIGNELFWWVREDARSTRAAMQLMLSLEQWAKESGCAVFCMVDVPALDSSAVNIYQRRGYEMAERTWIRRVE